MEGEGSGRSLTPATPSTIPHNMKIRENTCEFIVQDTRLLEYQSSGLLVQPKLDGARLLEYPKVY
jgi:hypothetical protein